MLVGVEEVERLPGAACTRLVARALHVADRVERIAVGDARGLHPSERGIELGTREREREVHPALGSPWRELERQLRRDPNDGEWTVFALMSATEDHGEELD